MSESHPVMDIVERLVAPGREQFFERFVRAGRPALITGLYQGKPLARLRSLSDALSALGEMPVLLREEYTGNLLRNEMRRDRNPAQPATLASYLALVEREPDTYLMTSEVHTPPALRALFEPPACASCGDDPGDTRSMMFIGRAGQYAHLHFDGDYRHVLLYQVFGHKRVHLFPPESWSKLLPWSNFSGVFLEHMRPAETAAFVSFAGGATVDLHAGEAVYIPACFWHQVEYVEPSMSVNWRFGRNRFTRFLGDRCHATAPVQGLAWALADVANASPVAMEAFATVEQAHRAVYLSPRDMAAAIESVCQGACERLYPEAQVLRLFAAGDALRDAALAAEAHRQYGGRANTTWVLSGWPALQ